MNINQDRLLQITSSDIKYDLKRTMKLLKICGNPETNIKSIQIVGTNGKGSTAAFLSKIIEKHQYKVGLYTSPHLSDYKERIRINSQKILDKDIEEFLTIYEKNILKERVSFFELMTVLSIWYFQKNNVDIAILETGLGGKLDSVTACKNDFVVFTPISMDHHKILGNTLYKIATQKAGAITNKKQVCLSCEQKTKAKEALDNYVKKKGGKILYFTYKDKYNKKISPKHLTGKHQKRNAHLAIKTIQLLNKHKWIKTDNKTVLSAIQDTKWPGRMDLISQQPQIIYDVAHNQDSFDVLIENLKTKKTFANKYLICGFEHNKKIRKALKKIEFFFDEIICTETGIRKSMSVETLTAHFSQANKIKSIKNVDTALKHIINKAKKTDLIVITGSHFFAPKLEKLFKNCFAMH